ncbi:LytTR family DNA-binding domain-containing protein [Phenylobacterium sp.]|uniref:LytTR family DNA-binding domain-containing protein n=1 Tax=Phenylobacterium sp. TaxID=1871053 RepID=UPI00286D24A1|nr:LytTR family DNA-binding domain-containing protein [Phenylobacterium sp.]
MGGRSTSPSASTRPRADTDETAGQRPRRREPPGLFLCAARPSRRLPAPCRPGGHRPGRGGGELFETAKVRRKPAASRLALGDGSRFRAAGFVRIHRSRLVRRDAVATVESRPTGDFRVRLRDGRELAGSRRYRRPLLIN